jgi:hypothetical protein
MMLDALLLPSLLETKISLSVTKYRQQNTKPNFSIGLPAGKHQQN